MLDPATSAAAVKSVNANLLAGGMGQTNYTPPLKADDPEVRALASLFGYQSGVEVIPATIQYLNERKQMEVRLPADALEEHDPDDHHVGRPRHGGAGPRRRLRVRHRVALAIACPGAYWLMPCGHHYVQHDQPAAMARIIRLTLGTPAPAPAVPAVPFNLTADACGPVLVAREQEPGIAADARTGRNGSRCCPPVVRSSCRPWRDASRRIRPRRRRA